MTRQTMKFSDGIRVSRVLWLLFEMGHQNMFQNLQRETWCFVESLRRYINNEPYDSLFEYWVLKNHKYHSP